MGSARSEPAPKSMNPIAAAMLLALSLFLGMLILLVAGRHIGAQRIARDGEGARTGTGAIDAAVFALLGLLVAFTFSNAASKFDTRRNLIVDEANAIGTAYLRLDLVPEARRNALRESFRRYVDARLALYRVGAQDQQRFREAFARVSALQLEIWNQTLAATQDPGAASGAPMLLLPALNEMIDVTSTRTLATEMHPPVVIFGLLALLALASALLAGYGMAGSRSPSWLHMIGFAAVMALAVYIIVDLEYPRLGVIRVDAFDQALVDVRSSMQ